MRFLLVTALLVVVIALPSDQQLSDDPTSPCYQQDTGRYVNNPARCRAFFSCLNGVATPLNCPVGYHFNEAAQICDLEKDYPCVDAETTIPTIYPETTYLPTTTPAYRPSPATTPDPYTSVCRGLNDGYFVNNPITCAAYWVCLNGNAYMSSCREGLNFNEELQVCDNPENYPCFDEYPPPDKTTPEPTSTPTPTPTPTSTPAPTPAPTPTPAQTAPPTPTPPPTTENPGDPDNPFLCPPHGIHVFPFADTCTTFRLCFSGALRIRSCAAGLQFDAINGRCDMAAKVNCVRGICPAENDPDNIVTTPSRNHCGEFFVCYDGELQGFQCAPGLSWNQAMGHCDFPANVDCQDDPQMATSTTEAPLHIECPADDVPGPHIIPHPRDCARYFICSLGVPYARSCPQDLLFDPVMQSCNKPDRVVCFVVAGEPNVATERIEF